MADKEMPFEDFGWNTRLDTVSQDLVERAISEKMGRMPANSSMLLHRVVEDQSGAQIKEALRQMDQELARLESCRLATIEAKSRVRESVMPRG